MFGFGKKKKKQISPADLKKVVIKPLDYHPKIILAWAKAIEGNKQLSQYLVDNGFEELNVAASAISLNREAREWLMNNGFPHLMAMINAAEGDQRALKWLQSNDFEILAYMAMAIEDEEGSWAWLKQNTTQDIFLLTQSIKRVKDQIEENHNDVHSFGKDT